MRGSIPDSAREHQDLEGGEKSATEVKMNDSNDDDDNNIDNNNNDNISDTRKIFTKTRESFLFDEEKET